ncbi:MAG: TRAM domain-containing protein [Candidatus Woesearchaeota archaeon]
MEYGEKRRSFSGGGGNRYGGDRGGGSRGMGGGGYRGGSDHGFSPVKEGEEINAVIEAVAEKGDGIAKKAGFVIFVPGTKVGDKVKIRVKKVAKKVAFAEVVGSYEEGTTSEAAAPSEDAAAPAEQAEEAAPEENYDASQDSEEF